MELVPPIKKSKKQERLDGRKKTIEMFKATYGALLVGRFQGEHAAHVAECMNFVKMLIERNEEMLQKEDPQPAKEEPAIEQEEVTHD